MAHMAQVEQKRNTKSERFCKSRNWQFTLNNYTVAEIKGITECPYQYIFQEETGKEGTPHLQGMIANNNAISFNTVKKLLPRAHIEVAKNKMALINYCKKGDTRTGKIYCNVESWLSGTNSGTTQDPRSMTTLEKEIWIQTQVDESIKSHNECCIGNKCWCKMLCSDIPVDD